MVHYRLPHVLLLATLKLTFLESPASYKQTSLQEGFLTIDTYVPSLGDYKEGYYIGVEVPADDPQSNKPFYGPNQWPSEGILSLFSSYFFTKAPLPKTE